MSERLVVDLRPVDPGTLDSEVRRIVDEIGAFATKWNTWWQRGVTEGFGGNGFHLGELSIPFEWYEHSHWAIVEAMMQIRLPYLEEAMRPKMPILYDLIKRIMKLIETRIEREPLDSPIELRLTIWKGMPKERYQRFRGQLGRDEIDVLFSRGRDLARLGWPALQEMMQGSSWWTVEQIHSVFEDFTDHTLLEEGLLAFLANVRMNPVAQECIIPEVQKAFEYGEWRNNLWFLERLVSAHGLWRKTGNGDPKKRDEWFVEKFIELLAKRWEDTRAWEGEVPAWMWDQVQTRWSECTPRAKRAMANLKGLPEAVAAQILADEPLAASSIALLSAKHGWTSLREALLHETLSTRALMALRKGATPDEMLAIDKQLVTRPSGVRALATKQIEPVVGVRPEIIARTLATSSKSDRQAVVQGLNRLRKN